MDQRPSIKGTLLSGWVEELRRLRERGAISPEEIESRLQPEDRELFEREPLAFHWYDVEIFRRLAALARDRAGGGRDEYIRERGFSFGEQLIEAGVYQQIDYLDRAEMFEATSEQERIEAGRRDLRLLVTLSSSLISFSRWQVVPDPEHELRFRIEVSDAGEFCDELAWYVEGVIDAMATRQGLKGLWRWVRLSEDVVIFRMTRDPLHDLGSAATERSYPAKPLV